MFTTNTSKAEIKVTINNEDLFEILFGYRADDDEFAVKLFELMTDFTREAAYTQDAHQRNHFGNNFGTSKFYDQGHSGINPGQSLSKKEFFLLALVSLTENIFGKFVEDAILILEFPIDKYEYSRASVHITRTKIKNLDINFNVRSFFDRFKFIDVGPAIFNARKLFSMRNNTMYCVATGVTELKNAAKVAVAE